MTNKENPDYVRQAECDKLYNMQEKRLERIEAKQDMTAERLNEIKAIITNGLYEKTKENVTRILRLEKNAQQRLWMLIGALVTLIANLIVTIVIAL